MTDDVEAHLVDSQSSNGSDNRKMAGCSVAEVKQYFTGKRRSRNATQPLSPASTLSSPPEFISEPELTEPSETLNSPAVGGTQNMKNSQEGRSRIANVRSLSSISDGSSISSQNDSLAKSGLAEGDAEVDQQRRPKRQCTKKKVSESSPFVFTDGTRRSRKKRKELPSNHGNDGNNGNGSEPPKNFKRQKSDLPPIFVREIHGKTHLQSKRCINTTYLRFERCVSCIAKQTDMCRFVDFRLFGVKDDAVVEDDTKALVYGPTFKSITDPDPASEHEKIEVSMKQQTYILDMIAPTYNKILKKELPHFKNAKTRKIPYLEVAQLCDVCESKIFSGYWMCCVCGREICLSCYDEWDDERDSKIKYKCSYVRTHTREQMVPIYHYSQDEIMRLIEETEERMANCGGDKAVIEDDDYELPDPVQPPAPDHELPDPVQPPVPDHELPDPVQPPAPDHELPDPVQPPAPDHELPDPIQPPVPDHEIPDPVQPSIPDQSDSVLQPGLEQAAADLEHSRPSGDSAKDELYTSLSEPQSRIVNVEDDSQQEYASEFKFKIEPADATFLELLALNEANAESQLQDGQDGQDGAGARGPSQKLIDCEGLETPLPAVELNIPAHDRTPQRHDEHQKVAWDVDDLTEEIFQGFWREGYPILVKKSEKILSPQLWSPEYFKDKYGSVECETVDCKNGKVHRTHVMVFFAGFQDIKQRFNFRGKYPCLKLKDWPSTDDFADMFPDHFNDFMDVLPFKECTTRNGVLNLAHRLPIDMNRPDLGPKMYNAYGSNDGENGLGTTNLHLDMTDAVNMMAYAPEVEDRLEGEKDAAAAAVWDIYHFRDLPRVRRFLRKIAREWGLIMDHPIHDQFFYLNSVLRERLFKEEGVSGWRIYQNPGDLVFVPAGCAHQVCNYTSCIKVAVDFVSPEGVGRSYTVSQQFRKLSRGHKRRKDILQLPNILYHSWLTARKR